MPVQTQMQVRRGTASSWTSTNPTLAAGELGFETDTGKFKIGNGSSTWTGLSYAGGGQNTLTTYQYTATAGQTTFSGADANGNTLSYTAGAVQVYLNGALLQNTVDYAASTGTSVVLTGGAGLGDSLTILSLGSFTVSTDIPKSTLTAKGSIVAASGAATPANISVGANDTVLTADSSTATGLKWATPVAAADSWALISSTNLPTGASTLTISGIPLRKKLMILCGSVQTPASSVITMRINGDTGANYTAYGSGTEAVATYIPAAFNGAQFGANTSFTLLRNNNGTGNEGVIAVTLDSTNSTGLKTFNTVSAGTSSGGGNAYRAYQMFGFYSGTSVVSSITITSSTGNFTSAQPVLIYGTV